MYKIKLKILKYISKLFKLSFDIFYCDKCNSFNVGLLSFTNKERTIFYQRIVCKKCSNEKYYKTIKLVYNPKNKVNKLIKQKVLVKA